VLISIWGAIENTDLPMLLSRSTTPRLMWWLPRVIAAMLALHLALVVLLAIGRM
jgi:hypothetical protein